VAKTLEDGIGAALQTIDSGAMKSKVEEYRTVALSLVT
jgi:anthranilate phosphoribosyltransferase